MDMRLVFAMFLSAGLAACGGGTTASGPVPDAPTGLTAVPKDGYVLLDAASSTDTTITGYNIYWSTASGVTTANGTKFQVGAAPQAHTGLANGSHYYYVVTAVNENGESAASGQADAIPVAAAEELDTYYNDQWHLRNTNQAGGAAGEDINVEPAWAITRGSGVRIAIVDDGLEMAHEDLAPNVGANGLSRNYETTAASPTDSTNAPSDAESGHGTKCAGIAAARDLNGVGVRGVAPRATLVGYALTNNLTTSNEVDAMTLNRAAVGVSSNSWGDPDGIGELSNRRSTWKSAIDLGLTEGRNGKGTIYMWAAGNGAQPGNNTCFKTVGWDCIDNSNYDGRANYRGVMAVAAVNDQGTRSVYSEPGANLWVAAPGGEFCSTHTITTVDRTGDLGSNTAATANDYGDRNYTKCMNGTSAATPAAAGVVALMLAANPNLGWRDVKIIMALTARINDQSDADWSGGNTAPYSYNHKYGFGVVDADAAVTRAVNWTNVAAEVTPYTTPLYSVGVAIPDNSNTGKIDTRTVTGSGINFIEWVEITFTATNSPYSGDLDVTLTSPNNVVSHLAVPHLCEGENGACTKTYSAGWVFGSARHLGEAANGDWKLTVKDGYQGGTGSLSSWRLKFYGH